MTRSLHLIGLSLVAMGFYVLPAFGQTQAPVSGQNPRPAVQTGTQAGTQTEKDQKALSPQEFIRKASACALAEINLGRMAEKHGSSQAIKDFGQRLVKDHTKANDELNKLANRKNFPVAQKMDADHERLANQLSALNGTNFDQAFEKDMVKDHEKAVAMFEAQAKNGTDPDVKAFAEKTLPVVKEHLKMARDLSKKNKGNDNNPQKTIK